MNERKPELPDAAPRDVAQARVVVEAQRQRIASTLDELETRIVEKKETLEERLDVTRPLRQYVASKPLAAVTMAVAAGVLFGLLTGGGRHPKPESKHLTEEDRAAIRRWRKERHRELLDQEAGDQAPRRPRGPRPRKRGFLRDLTHELAGAASALLVAELVERVRNADD